MKNMYIFIFIALCHIQGCCCPVFASNHNEKQTYYISSSEGDDRNDGLSPETAKRTIKSIGRKSGVRILLKRGDVFFERLAGYLNFEISPYGKGGRPILCGFKILRNSSAWEKVADNIWRIDLTKKEDFVGYDIEGASNRNTVNNVGFIYDADKDMVYGHLVRYQNQLAENGDFYMTELHKPKDFEKNPFRYLYWKIDKNPKGFSGLCFPVYESGISGIKNGMINGISVVGFSIHGICNATDCVISNCQIDLIGGGNFIKDRWWSRFGNGIEFWTSKHQRNNIVKNCIVSRTYDCGMTIQCNDHRIPDVHNIKFINNRLYRCRQAFEHFITPSDTTCHPEYNNCEFTSNICLDMGENDFNTPEKRDASILSYERESKSMIIENNIFYGAPYYCGYVKPIGLRKNKVYIYKGQYLNHYHGKKNYPTILADGEETIKKYKDWSGDDSDIIIIERGGKKDSKLRRRIERKIGYKKPELHLERILNK